MPLYFRCKSCGSEHLSPIIFPDKRSYVSSHLKQNVFFCPSTRSAARYAKTDLFWRRDLPPLPEATASTSTIGPSPEGNGRILILDAVEASLRATEKVLEDAGYREIAALSDPGRSVEMFRSFQPDLLILELEMPGLDGFAVLQALAPVVAADPRFPILITSATTEEEVRLRALREGATDIISRPFQPMELLVRVRLLLRLRGLDRRLQSQERLIDQWQREEGLRREAAAAASI